MTIDASPAGASANSYGTLVEAEAYFLVSRMNYETWNESLEQEQALLYATLMLDRYDYIGIPLNQTPDEDGYNTALTQALKWPRVHPDGALIRNYPINIVPTPIKYAQFEASLWLVQTGGQGVAVAAGAVETLKIGNSIEAKYSSGSSGAAVVDTTIDPTGLPIGAARFLKGLRLYAVIG